MSSTLTSPAQERQLLITLKEAIEFYDDWRATDEATLRQLLKEFQADGKGFRFDKAELVEPKFAKLPWCGDMQNAMRTARRSADYVCSDATEGQIVKFVRSQGGNVDVSDPRVWISAINIVGREQGWPLNQTGHEKKVDAAVAAVKAHILQGKTTFPRFLANYGQVKYIDASFLDSLSPEELVALDTEVTELRRQMNQLPEDAKAERQARMSPAPKTDQDIQIKYADRAGARYTRADDNQSLPTPGKMDRSVPHSGNPNEDQLFTNPNTNAPYNAREIKALIGGSERDRNLFTLMMRTNLSRTNQLLNS